MENKINIVELLRNCPKGMELYSPIYGLGILTKVTDKIHVKFPKEHNVKCFRSDGKVSEDGEIMLYPKNKTTWEGFVSPCKFKDGDILVDKYNNIGIFQEYVDTYWHSYIYLGCDGKLRGFHIGGSHKQTDTNPATEKEKEKLFDAIKANGYKWNIETKTLETLPKFKVGDVIIDKDSYKVIITEINLDDKCYEYESLFAKGIGGILFSEQSNWKLVPNKFDVNSLKPFDKVLVRLDKNHRWVPQFFSRYDLKSINFPFQCIHTSWPECIPYKGNEHLANTTNDCSDFYKIWE